VGEVLTGVNVGEGRPGREARAPGSIAGMTLRSRKLPRVAVLVQTATGWSRSVLAGVAAYVREHGPWEVFLEPRGFHEDPQVPEGWRGDGVIARLSSPAVADAIARLDVPAVNVSWLGEHGPRAPKVVSDEAACGRVAAAFFLESGFRSFGYIGPIRRHGYQDELGAAFEVALAARGYPLATFVPRDGPTAPAAFYSDRDRFYGWLRALPRPVGLLAWNSESGREVAARALALGLDVPEDVAILCSEHDALVAAVSPVELSNIDQDPHQVGYQAAATLAGMMAGRPAPPGPTVVPPLGIVQRRSTDVLAIDDPTLRKALRFIRSEATAPIKVGDIAAASGASRRALEQRFLKVLGRSPARELRRVRIERAMTLLADTEHGLADIAMRVGFEHPDVLTRNFRAATGLTPAEWRRRRRQ
jgi:LacI family transcriptional regulator